MDMNEERPQNRETGPETDPTPEEIQAVFEKLTETNEYTEIRKLVDERGVYLWEISVAMENGRVEYEYDRIGPNPRGKGLQTAVYAVYYGKDGALISGSSVAQLINGIWNTNLTNLREWLPKD